MCPELQRWYRNYARRRGAVVETILGGAALVLNLCGAGEMEPPIMILIPALRF